MKQFILAAITTAVFISCGVSLKLLSAKELRKGNYQEVDVFFNNSGNSEMEPDVFPKYPNGLKGLMKDVNNEITYPSEERLNGIEGLVYVSYIVEKDGYIGEITVQQSASKGLDNEAVRVIKTLKRWYPGFKNGKPARVKMIQPFQFKLT